MKAEDAPALTVAAVQRQGLVGVLVEEVHSTEHRLYLVLLYGLGALMCLPFWLVDSPPLVDYPNHLARAYVIYHYDAVAAYQRWYELTPQLLPNLAFDLFVPMLLPFVPVAVAGKLFLTVTVCLFVAGCDMLGRAIHGRPTWLALPCLLFCYHAMLLFGFLNYSFGLGLFFVTFALWITFRASGRNVGLAVILVLALTCYVSHLSSLVFLTIGIGVVTVFDWLAGRRSLRDSLLWLTPLGLPLAIVPVYAVRIGQTRNVYWGTLTGKLSDAFGTISTYDYRLDHLVVLGIVVLACAAGLQAREWRSERSILCLAGLFAALFLATPEGVFETWKADWRFVPPAAVFALLAWRFQVDSWLGKTGLVLVVAILAGRAGIVASDWIRLDRQIAAQVRLIDSVEEGASVYPLVTYPPASDRRPMGHRAFWHIIQYGTINRHIHTPSLFAIRGQQVVAYKAPERYRFLAEGAGLADTDWDALAANYAYVWSYDVSPIYLTRLRERFEQVAAEAGGMLWRTHPRTAR